MHLKAKRNEYASALGKLLDETPKAVLAAIVVSLLTCGEDWLNDTDALHERFIQEWEALHANGVVPQKPPSRK